MKTIRFTLIALLLVIAGQALSAQTILGTWELSYTGDDGEQYMTTLSFNEDGSFTRDVKEPVTNFKNQTVAMYTHSAGKWKLSSNGKRITMRTKPSSITVNTDGDNSKAIAKLARISMKADGMSSIYTPKIVSLTEDKLILLENVDDGVSGPDMDIDYTHSEQFIYTRKN